MLINKNQIIKGSLGIEMATDYFVPEGDKLQVVIYTHGFNGFKDWGNFDLIAEEFAKAGFIFIKYNLSHNGTTLEHPTDFVDLGLYRSNDYTKELVDIGFVIDHVFSENFIYKNNFNRERVFLFGHSRGGATSILGAIDERIAGLVTWASIAACTSPWSRFSVEQMEAWKEKGVFYYENKRTNQQLPIDYQIYEDYLAHEEEYDLLSTVAFLKKPMLFIHGKDDPAVPYQSAEQLYSANAAYSKLLLCEGDHVFGRKHPWPHDYLPEETKFVVNETIQFLKL